jgi:hypothetical protein
MQLPWSKYESDSDFVCDGGIHSSPLVMQVNPLFVTFVIVGLSGKLLVGSVFPTNLRSFQGDEWTTSKCCRMQLKGQQ